MTRRLVALLMKELREHWLVFLLLCPLLAFGLLIVTASALAAQRSASVLDAGLFFTVTFVPLTALALGHRLVVVEWHGRTQLFLEALPLRRWEMVLVKYLLGLSILGAIALMGLLWAALLAVRSEPIDARFLAIMSARSLGFTWCLWSFLFGMGFTGRYRIPIYIGIAIGLMAIDRLSELDLAHFGPIELVSFQTWATERNVFPVAALQVSAALALAWTALAAVLATISEGSVAEVLSRPMSQKEKSVVGVLVVAGLVALTQLDERKQKAPYAFADEAVLRGARHQVEVLYVREAAREAARTLLEAVEADLAGLARLFPAARLPVVRVALRSSLDRTTFERAELEENDGVLVRANFLGHPESDERRALRAYLIREALEDALAGRATFEPKRWLHDGFSRWFVERERGAPTRPLELAASRPLLRALWSTRARPLAPSDLLAWDPLRERAGEPVAEGLAFSALWALELELGPEAVLALARGAFDRAATKDVRELLHERGDPLPALVARTTGLELEAFVAAWNARLEATAREPDVAAVLARLPRGTARLEVERGEGEVRAIAWGFELDPASAPETVCALVHCAIGPYDRELRPHELLREEQSLGTSGPWRLEGRYARGSRAFLALEVESQALGPLRLAAERRIIE